MPLQLALEVQLVIVVAVPAFVLGVGEVGVAVGLADGGVHLEVPVGLAAVDGMPVVVVGRGCCQRRREHGGQQGFC